MSSCTKSTRTANINILNKLFTPRHARTRREREEKEKRKRREREELGKGKGGLQTNVLVNRILSSEII